MKNLFKITSLLILTLTIVSCQGGKWDVTLYAQKIEGSSKLIYKYDAWGGRDSHKFGYAILDSSEVFDVNQITELAISYLEKIPDRKNVSAIYQAKPNNDKNDIFLPTKTYKIKDQSIIITVREYQYNGVQKVSSGLLDMKFSNFKETRDSLFFYDLDENKSKEKYHIDSLKLKKGNVIIRQKTNKELIEINIEDLVFSDNNTIISNKTYFLTPKKKLKSDEFSDYGIFKEKI